ncbi:MAG: hypothetical protein J0L76_16900, partial [Rhodobacterales bacterium]|nr:hypothetical protein [Rhodobacterales bacterium]
RVGLQTEHILDRDGNRMWRFVKRRQRRVFAQSYDALLDLSPDNATAYDFLEADLRQKIQFGPHIFPDDDIEHEFVDAPPLFFGSLNDRRRGILDRLKSVRPLEIASHGTFGAGLDKLLAAHGSVLNIHYQEAEYAEYPRFLKAYLAGKPFISEPLSAPLVAGLHYLELNEVATRERTEHVFGSIRTLASGYRLRNYLERVIQSHVAR